MASRNEKVRRELLHRLGEPCDICDGGGLDYLGRECRLWDKSGDPNYPPPAEVRPAQPRILFFGGPLNETTMAVRPGESVVLAPVPERASFSLSETAADPMAPSIRTVRYDIEKVGVPIGRDHHVWRVAVAEGFPRHRITDAMNVVLVLCSLPICGGRRPKIAP